MEYDLTTRRKETLIHTISWTNLENIMLSEKNQSQKATYDRSPQCEMSSIGKVH